MNNRELTTKIAMRPRKPGRPKGIPEEKDGRVISLYNSGFGYRAIARELEYEGITVTYSTVRRVIKAWIKQGHLPECP